MKKIPICAKFNRIEIKPGQNQMIGYLSDEIYTEGGQLVEYMKLPIPDRVWGTIEKKQMVVVVVAWDNDQIDGRIESFLKENGALESIR